MTVSPLPKAQAAEYQPERLWQAITEEAKAAVKEQPMMASYFHANVLNHKHFAGAICFILASRLGCNEVPAITLQEVIREAIADDPAIVSAMIADLMAHYTRDAACDEHITPLLYFKGFHAIQSYRIGHWLWKKNRRLMARFMQSRISELFDVDIHPAAFIGSGIMLDHATGVVVGETSVIGDDVSMLHQVTLGGSGCDGGERHPKVRRGVLLSAGAKLLGNIEIGECAKIAAGSLVLSDVPAHATVAGVPAKQVGKARVDMPSLDMNQSLDD